MINVEALTCCEGALPDAQRVLTNPGFGPWKNETGYRRPQRHAEWSEPLSADDRRGQPTPLTPGSKQRVELPRRLPMQERRTGRSGTRCLHCISQLIHSMRRPTPLNQCNSFPELGVFGLGLLQDSDVGVGVLPESQEIFIPLAGGGFVAHHFLRPGDLQMC